MAIDRKRLVSSDEGKDPVKYGFAPASIQKTTLYAFATTSSGSDVKVVAVQPQGRKTGGASDRRWDNEPMLPKQSGKEVN